MKYIILLSLLFTAYAKDPKQAHPTSKTFIIPPRTSTHRRLTGDDYFTAYYFEKGEYCEETSWKIEWDNGLGSFTDCNTAGTCCPSEDGRYNLPTNSNIPLHKELTITLTDSWGDGWNGATLALFYPDNSKTVFFTVTAAQGGSEDDPVIVTVEALVTCDSDADCANVDGRLICSADKKCKECTEDTHCVVDGKLICDADNQCKECTEHTHCASGESCSTTNACFTPGTGTQCEHVNSTGHLTWNGGDDIPENHFRFSFNPCPELKHFYGPSVKTVGNYAFRGTALESVNLPEATKIEIYAFRECNSLTNVNLPEATTIEQYAFSLCGSLTSMNLPAATTFGVLVFYGSPLTSVSLPTGTFFITSNGNIGNEVECTDDTHCAVNSNGNFCVSNMCKECTDDTHCAGVAGKPKCGEDNTCKPCTDTDNFAGKEGNDCALRTSNSWYCKVNYDHGDFVSATMCCACGGGEAECTENTDCTSGLCKTDMKVCAECTDDSHCANVAGKPFCYISTSQDKEHVTNTCQECNDDSQCVDNPNGNQCKEYKNKEFACVVYTEATVGREERAALVKLSNPNVPASTLKAAYQAKGECPPARL